MSDSPAAVLDSIRRFLRVARDPYAAEPGESPLPIRDGCYELQLEGNRLVLQVWNETRNLARRITGVKSEAKGRLDLTVQRFAKAEGTLRLVDQAVPRNVSVTQRALREAFREQFRRSLLRQFPGWQLRDLSCEPDLQHSLSPAYPRGFLTRGNTGVAAIAAPPDSASPDGALAFGLIWLDYLRRRDRRVHVGQLCVFMPEGSERTVCLRVLCLNATIRCTIFAYGEHGEVAVDPNDYGNLDTRIGRLAEPVRGADWMEPIAALDGVAAVPTPFGISWRVRGWEFAAFDGQTVRFGLERKRRAEPRHLPEIAALSQELRRMRSHDAVDRHNPIYRALPERWLESEVRGAITAIDAGLQPSPVYGQVPAIVGLDRDVLDLLAIDGTGRLCVLELKAGEDLQLPMQALDYWLRVRWHAARGDFAAAGYFGGHAVRQDPPHLFLIAPALDFHPTTETLLSFYSSEIVVERVGVSSDWRRAIKVVDGAGNGGRS